MRRLRTERGVSQGELASAVQVSRQTINSIERERYTPSLQLAFALARYFDKAIEELFDPDGRNTLGRSLGAGPAGKSKRVVGRLK